MKSSLKHLTDRDVTGIAYDALSCAPIAAQFLFAVGELAVRPPLASLCPAEIESAVLRDRRAAYRHHLAVRHRHQPRPRRSRTA